jgi:hypothetical protein
MENACYRWMPFKLTEYHSSGLQLLRKNINCSSSINTNDKSCFKWYISRYIFQNNCVNIYDKLCFFLVLQKLSYQENHVNVK